MWKGINISLIHNREKEESRGEKTCEVRTRDSITVLDRKRDVDHRFGPRVFVDLEIGERRKQFAKFLKHSVVKESGPTVIVHGHINEKV
jgi:hypothetical protein